MEWNNVENKSYTVGDGKTIWHSRSCAVTNMVFLNNFSELLVVKRGPACPDEVGKWCLPCGYIDWNETAYDAARREVYEETGLDLEGAGFVSWRKDQPWFVNSSPSSNLQNISMYYAWQLNKSLATAVTQPPPPETSMEHCEPGEVDEIKWMNVHELITSKDMEMAFNHRKMIGEFFRRELNY